MVSTTELFDLIKKMTKSEKRHFTLNAQFQEGSKAYFALFQEINKLGKYDEPALKNSLKGQGFKIENLAVAKVQLAKLILKSLRTFYEGSSPEQRILSMLTEADILKKKGLYQQAIKHLEKAKTTARHFEMHYHIFEILNRQAHIWLDTIGKGTAEKLNLLFEEMERLKATVHRETELRVLATKITLTLHTKPLKHPETLANIEEMEQHGMLQGINDNDSFFAKLNYFFTHAQLNHARGNYAAANPHYLKILEIWGRHPHIREINPRLYKTHIANYLNSCHTLGNYEAFDTWLEKFRQIEDTNFDEEAGSFKDFYHISLLYLLNTGQLRKALNIVPDIEKGLVAYKPKINKARETALRFNVFITFFINEKFSEALDWLGTMELDNKIESKADARALARIMRVIVHYELGHARILDNLRTSVYRNLKKQEQLHEFERTILDHIRLLEQTIDKKAIKSLWENLFKKLNEIGETYGWNKIAGLEEITCWAESRLLKKPYVQVLEEKKQR